MFVRVLFASLPFLILPRAFADIGVGDARAAVIQQAGTPSSHAQRGNREILLYPNGGRVELIDGKVTDVKGPLPSAAVAAPAAPAAATPTSTATAAAPAESNPGGLPAEIAREEQMANPAAAADALGRSVEKMDTAWGPRPPAVPVDERPNWPRLLVLLGLHFGITLLGLRIAFKVEEMDAFWSGTLAIAAIDLAVYGGLEVLGPFTGGVSNMSGVQGGIGALVMVGTIQKFCFNKRLQNAVITAMSVKLVVQLCHIFAFVFLLNALFG